MQVVNEIMDAAAELNVTLNLLRMTAYKHGIAKTIICSIWFLCAWASYGWTYAPCILGFTTGIIAIQHFADARNLRTNSCCCAPISTPLNIYYCAICNAIMSFLGLISSIAAAAVTDNGVVRVFAVVSAILAFSLFVAECFVISNAKALDIELRQDPVMVAQLAATVMANQMAAQPGMVVAAQPVQPAPQQGPPPGGYGYPNQQQPGGYPAQQQPGGYPHQQPPPGGYQQPPPGGYPQQQPPPGQYPPQQGYPPAQNPGYGQPQPAAQPHQPQKGVY